MQAKIQKWGNSLALRIPKSFALNVNIKQNELVDLLIDKGKIVIKPITQKKYSLEELLEGVSENNLHSEFDTGAPTGKELW
ncbi:MAG: AbrB/MazE/SpoVT family DNA-binding domain-containing protein [Deltaproteobacteria bacterium]|nr:AbrB/MazE/SpoVT family DNA-binding domain-containing protein [Deltaproteobacteria bacterium]MBW2651037.1 AbrB/MazE/SpoVT family DNA-binding domain-containing protein [Deltaproteobacteria bacterium]